MFSDQGAQRCVRCRELYDEFTESPCRYHPGVYGGGVVGLPSLGRVGWSCCSAADELAPGCNLGKHYPSGILGSPSNGLRQRRTASGSSDGRTAASLQVPRAEDERSGAASSSATSSSATSGIYVVGVGDSIATVSMKSGVRRDQLIKVLLFAAPQPERAPCCLKHPDSSRRRPTTHCFCFLCL